MDIALIGTGRVGTALAHGLSRTTHRVFLGVRDPSSGGVKALAAATGATALSPAGAAAAADVVILALPWDAAEAAVAALGDLAGKIVIDCMNPVARGPQGMGLALGHSTSGAEVVAGWLPGARLVKTLNQVGAEVMAEAGRFTPAPLMFMAADDAAAKATVGLLLTDLGFAPLDAGGLALARLLEPLAMLWIHQSLVRGRGRDWAFATATRRP